MKIPRLALQLACAAMSCASIGGAFYALSFPELREQYWAAVPILFLSGVAWLACAAAPSFRLTRIQYLFLFALLLLGCVIGLVSEFKFCGGEAFCHSYRGYPGRWLRVTWDMETPRVYWNIDTLSALANIVFWCGAGVILICFRNAARLLSHQVSDRAAL